VSERTLLQEGEVTVSETQLRVGSERYALGSIRSVHSVREPPAANGPVLMAVAGGICLLSAFGEAGLTGAAIGAGLLAAAGVWWMRKQPSFQVHLESDEGDFVPFESRNAELTQRVVSALAEALAARNRGGDAKAVGPSASE
jgi:hypothetical protein